MTAKESEETIGKALHELKLSDKFNVVTKPVPLTPEELASPSLAAKSIRQSVETSLKRLRVDTLPVVLFHRNADVAQIEALEAMCDKGLVRHVGLSLERWMDNSMDFLGNSRIEAFQIPANILDRHHFRPGGFVPEAARKGLPIFVRSVFLQGLLFMPEDSIPENLRPVIPVRRNLSVLAAEAGISLAELAVRYIISQKGVSCLIMGIDNASQLRSNITLFSKDTLPQDLLSRIEDAAQDLPYEVVTPICWKK